GEGRAERGVAAAHHDHVGGAVGPDRRHSIAPSLPLWEPRYQSRPRGSSVSVRTPTFARGRRSTRNRAVFGSKVVMVSAASSLTHTRPVASTPTAVGPDGLEGIGHSSIRPPAGSSRPSRSASYS